MKDAPTWDDYLKKHTVGPVLKSTKKDEIEGNKTPEKTPEKDIDSIYGDRISTLIAS